MSHYPEPDEGQYYNNHPPRLVSDPPPPIAAYPYPQPGGHPSQSPPPQQNLYHDPYAAQSQPGGFYQPQQPQSDFNRAFSPPPVNNLGYTSPPPRIMSPNYDPRHPPPSTSTPGFISPPPHASTPIPMSQLAYSHSTPAGFPTSNTPGPFDPHSDMTSPTGLYPPSASHTPMPMPSPGEGYDDDGREPSYGHDWHPSRTSLADDGVSLLPRGGEPPGGWGDNGIGGAGDMGLGGVDEEDEDQLHYGPVPSRVPRRNKTVKRIKLYMGHLVLDCPVPSKLLDNCPNKTDKEFTTMRYTAVTCDPNDFKDDRYALRQILYEEVRKTELFIVLTMYNEDDELFLRTLRGCMQNIDYLCTKSKSKTWNQNGWQKVVVCIVSDGRSKINPRTLAVIQKLGCYQPGPAKNMVNGKPVTAHLYEYTTQFRVNSKLQVVPGNADSVPVQLLFCLKEKNQKKLNSHRWFFNAFGAILVPNVCVLIDVGTQPGSRSIYHLWKSFDLNSEVGGACGEIAALKGPYWSTLFKNPLVAAQNFEYKMSNILDKPLESVFGFISVLPGAFSAYRYIAVQNDPVTGEGPLQKYFLGETMHGANAGIFDANMYLAEDRILCWELVSKRNSSWHLHYVKSAIGTTDVPDTIPDLVSQRRRWLNGSFFASVHATYHFYQMYRSRHSYTRKFFLHILIFYQLIQLIFSWFGIGNYFIAFYVLTKSMEGFVPALKWLNLILTYVYCGLTIACFLMALGNRPKGSKVGYSLAFVVFAIITVYMTFAAFYTAFRSIRSITNENKNVRDILSNTAFAQIVLSLLGTFGIYILASLIHYDPWHLLTSMIQYVLIAPSYISVLNVYAFCNTHDISWGTKGQDKVSMDLGVVTSGKGGDAQSADVNVTVEATDLNAEFDDAIRVLEYPAPKVVDTPSPEDVQDDYYKSFRTRLLLAWVLSNGALVAIVMTATSTFTGVIVAEGVERSVTIYLTIILYCVFVLAIFRFCGSLAYIIVRLFIGE